MNDPRKPIREAINTVAGRDVFSDPGNTLALDNLLDAFSIPRDDRAWSVGRLSLAIMLELIHHEGIVLEAYKDTSNVWTWGLGVTAASGHTVSRYKDNPSTLHRALEVAEWLVRTVYLPPVLKAFAPIQLTEAQLAAALSFHWNTGAITTAKWVEHVRNGAMERARASLTSNFLNKGVLQGRRDAEAKLFFDGEWSNDGLASIIPVRKPLYQPNFSQLKRVDIRSELTAVMLAAE